MTLLEPSKESVTKDWTLVSPDYALLFRLKGTAECDPNEHVRYIAKKELELLESKAIDVHYQYTDMHFYDRYEISMCSIDVRVDLFNNHRIGGLMRVFITDNNDDPDNTREYHTANCFVEIENNDPDAIKKAPNKWELNHIATPEMYYIPENIQIVLWLICDFELIECNEVLIRLEDVLRKQKGSIK